MTGTDEHGLKIQQTADKSGTTPKAFVDEMATKFKAMADRLDCSYDRFIRTTDADHLPSTQELWRRMQEKGTSISPNIPAGTRSGTRPITTRAS